MVLVHLLDAVSDGVLWRHTTWSLGGGGEGHGVVSGCLPLGVFG